MKHTMFFLALPFLLLQACQQTVDSGDRTLPRNEVIPVRVVTAEKENAGLIIRTSGIFTTDDETYLSFKTGGVIEKIYVNEGDAVKQGQVLARLNLTEINAQVAQARLAYEKAIRDYNRVENLFRDSVATLEQYQNARTGLEVATRQLEAANFNRNYSEIKAVANGFVLKKLSSESQVISPGIPVLLTNGAGTSQWKLKTTVSDRDWAAIRVGDKATITTDIVPGSSFEGIVTRKSEGSEVVGGSFTIEITLEGSVTGLAAGLYGNASIRASQQESLWKIPYESLLDGNAQYGYVFITEDGKQVRKIPVRIARLERDHVYIHSGLEAGMKIIVSGSAYLRDGSQIEIVN